MKFKNNMGRLPNQYFFSPGERKHGGYQVSENISEKLFSVPKYKKQRQTCTVVAMLYFHSYVSFTLHIFSVCRTGGGDGLHNQPYLKRGI